MASGSVFLGLRQDPVNEIDVVPRQSKAERSHVLRRSGDEII
jgi:hypothetical protein